MKKRKNFIKEKHLLSKLSETWITEQNTPFFFLFTFYQSMDTNRKNNVR